MDPATRAWLVHWKLIGEPIVLSVDMLLTVPAEVFGESALVYDLPKRSAKYWPFSAELPGREARVAVHRVTEEPAGYDVDVETTSGVRDCVCFANYVSLERAREAVRRIVGQDPTLEPDHFQTSVLGHLVRWRDLNLPTPVGPDIPTNIGWRRGRDAK